MAFTRDENPFAKSHWIAERYARQLRDTARQIGRIIGGHDAMTMNGLQVMQRALEMYSGILRPWAVKVAQQTGEQLNRQDRNMWFKQSREIGRGLRQLIENEPAGQTLQEFLERQVHYITSLPIEAGQRVHQLSLEAMVGGRRPDEIAAEIMRSGEVTESRATLIARTECARTASLLTQVRAQGIGATNYIWRTSKDRAVRASHRSMEGKVCDLANPPTLSDGTTTAPGQIYNCFVGSTKVSLRDGCNNLWRYWHDGTIVSVTVDSGEIFHCTPNHPILTSNGWCAANDLKQGDQLLTSARNGVGAVDHNETDFETTFDDLFRSFSLSSGTNCKPRGSVEFNFHGDSPEGEVDHIRVDRKLLLDFITRRAQDVSDFTLSDADSGILSACDCSLSHGGESSISGLGNSVGAFVGGHGLHADAIGFGASPKFDAVMSKPLSDAFASEAKSLGQREQAFAIDIGDADLSDGGIATSDHFLLGDNVRGPVSDLAEGATEVVLVTPEISSCLGEGFAGFKQNYCTVKKVDREFRSCHVYTMESYTGSYSITSARIISKNCRCTMQIILPEI